MGIAFDLATVNWLAHLLQPGGHIPRRAAPDEHESLEMFLSQLPERFVSSRGNKDKVREVAEAARAQLSQIPYGQEIPLEILESLQQLFSHYPWIGMIVPSMKNMELDRFLASPEFLYDLVHKVNWQDDGLIMQPRDLDDHPQALLDVFPPFQTALNAMTRWPGLLFWRPNEDSVFLPFAGKTPAAVRECAGWALSNLKISRFRGLKTFEAEYFRRFPEARATAASTTTLLHISDLHIGSTEAATSLPRLQQLLRNQIHEIPNGQKVVLVISGDLIDDPKDEYYNSARQFLDTAQNLTEEPPILVLGNHDVRTDGYLSENLRNAIKLPTNRVRWFDDRPLGLVCFNSVAGGRLAAGKIGPEQFADVGNEIDHKRDWRITRWLAYSIIIRSRSIIPPGMQGRSTSGYWDDFSRRPTSLRTPPNSGTSSASGDLPPCFTGTSISLALRRYRDHLRSRFWDAEVPSERFRPMMGGSSCPSTASTSITRPGPCRAG
ncbi:hypothetical protein ABIB94_009173 [Bradyrhizobium sp. JR7.2]|uniref:metallophosphoesterase family protein n=1 Tax=unclassified Bradyrhizobium TaxID=2631580 RepID=UPI0033914244